MQNFYFIPVLVILCWSNFSSGQTFTESSCKELMPQDMAGEPAKDSPPFTIQVNKQTYKAGDNIQVKIQSQEPIKGFMLAARLADAKLDKGKNYGIFKTNNIQTTQLCQTDYGTGIAAELKEPKNSLEFEWTSYPSTKGHLYFRGSVVLDQSSYWVGEPSVLIIDESSPPPPKVPSPDQIPSSEAFKTSDCGKTKGCYRQPPGCLATNCDAILMWEDHKDHVDFQMVGDTEGWVQALFSKDPNLGEDDGFECYRDPISKRVDVRQIKYKSRDKQYPIPYLRNKNGWLNERKIYCTFRKDKNARDQPTFLNENRYILLSKGRVDDTGRRIRHPQEMAKYPFVSPEQIKMSEKINLEDTLRYPLVKLHGCLMVIGWMICAMLGLLLSKYYRPMWPNSRWCGKRIWYSGYMICMFSAMILTIVSFIIIFIHGNGYIDLPVYPDKAHPPIGICVTILVILIPILAFCRPVDPGNQSGPGVCVNWILWLFETLVSVLATVNLFIGLNLPKAHAPWWAGWVMVVFFLFHLITELILEIFGCLNSRKQDLRYQKFVNEQKVRNEPEPNPVGHNFKQRTITIYLIVSIVLGFIVVISIATG